MSAGSTSPRLPTFAVRDLAGPGQPPGLISISKSQYESTIKSQPDAKLLYVDDDDNELITVGSSLELSQRLDEPVLNYRQHPIDGKLIHIFDIKHTKGSVAEWRDHEAYSSKALRPRSPSSSSRCSEPHRYVDTSYYDWLNTTDVRPLKHPESAQVEQPKQAELVQSEEKVETPSTADKPSEAFNILDGIEEHLSGLASVLQLAATTLQKAADKTRSTDTTVVEDILKGVKDILTEVGSFGMEAYKELHSVNTLTAQEHDSIRAEQRTKDQQIAMKLADEAMSLCESSKPPARVKFAAVEDEIVDSLVRPDTSFSKPTKDTSRPAVIHRKIQEPPHANNASILDDPSEDPDFTARYPPLRSIRRVRSTIDPGSSMRSYQPIPSTEPFYMPYRPKPSLPAHLAPRPLAWDLECGSFQAPVNEGELSENCEIPAKPVPGAWPDVKNDPSYSLPASTESSGAFFNRMAGRAKLAEANKCSIQRANTTASSNPASRLNGPFDPGFPYEPSSGHIQARCHKKADDVSRSLSDRISVREKNDWPRLDHRKSMPSFARSARRNALNLDTRAPAVASTDNDDWVYKPLLQHEPSPAVKHHRSVPQFKPFAVPPPPPERTGNFDPSKLSARVQGLPSKSDYSTPAEACSQSLNSPGFSWQQNKALSGPAPPFAPFLKPADQSLRRSATTSSVASPISPMPLTSRPTLLFPPRPTFNAQINPFDEKRAPPYNSNVFPPSCENPVTRLESAPSPPPVFSRPNPPAPTFSPPVSITSRKNKFDSCIEQLRMCGFGVDDENLKNRLHVYAVAADGNVEDAVEMIEEDRRLSAERRLAVSKISRKSIAKFNLEKQQKLKATREEFRAARRMKKAEANKCKKLELEWEVDSTHRTCEAGCMYCKNSKDRKGKAE